MFLILPEIGLNEYAVAMFTASRKIADWLFLRRKKNKDAANKDAELSLLIIYPTQASCFTPWSRQFDCYLIIYQTV